MYIAATAFPEHRLAEMTDVISARRINSLSPTNYKHLVSTGRKTRPRWTPTYHYSFIGFLPISYAVY